MQKKCLRNPIHVYDLKTQKTRDGRVLPNLAKGIYKSLQHHHINGERLDTFSRISEKRNYVAIAIFIQHYIRKSSQGYEARERQTFRSERKK